LLALPPEQACKTRIVVRAVPAERQNFFKTAKRLGRWNGTDIKHP
jgi:hypothetical protein